jgi:hypothetical protein
LVYSLIKVLMKVIRSSITHGVTGAHWCNLHSRGIMAAVWELSGERGGYFLRGKARGEVNLGVDKVKRRKEHRKVGLSIVTLHREIGVALGAPCGGEK